MLSPMMRTRTLQAGNAGNPKEAAGDVCGMYEGGTVMETDFEDFESPPLVVTLTLFVSGFVPSSHTVPAWSWGCLPLWWHF